MVQLIYDRKLKKGNPGKKHIGSKKRAKASIKAFYGIHSEIYKCKYVFT